MTLNTLNKVRMATINTSRRPISEENRTRKRETEPYIFADTWFRVTRRRTYLAVTHKALAFPASSARRSLRCCQFTARQTLPVTFVGPRRNTPREMVLLTMIARLADGLPLAASMQEDEQVKWSALCVVVVASCVFAVVGAGCSRL